MALETGSLENALAAWQRGSPEPLLSALRFEPLGLEVPQAALAEFGLHPQERLSLQVAARYRSFHVFTLRLRGGLDPEVIRRTAAALYRHNPARRALLFFESPGDPRLVVASWGLGPGPFRLHKLWIDLAAPRASELDILAGLAVDDALTAAELALAHSRALDREQVTRRFFTEFRRHRAELAARLTGLPNGAVTDRLDLALVLLSRLLFLYFIQRKGWLAGDRAYLRQLYESTLRAGYPFYRRRLKRLFFGALDRPAAERGALARELGELPYLNGGLFERDALERKYPRLDVPDDCFAPIFDDLLDRYQFTLREDQPADQDVAVDPEMLGKVFEGLMAGPDRGSSGTFYTPRALVDRLVDGALQAYLARAAAIDARHLQALLVGERPDLRPSVRERLLAHVRAIRVLDPAVGSGAFLLAALRRLEALHDALEGRPDDSFARFERRREIIRHNLHGVDISSAAVRLCELRLWLALIVDLKVESIADVPPLPNLDINVRQGDALFDPIDFLIQLADLDYGNLATRWTKEVGRLTARRDRYFHSSGTRKRRAQRAIREAERQLAIRFLGELAEQIDARRRELGVAARGRDLFGRRAGLSSRQRRLAKSLGTRRRELSHLLRRIRATKELPFFSFPIHFADPGQPAAAFHVVVGNPPWVRPHHWPKLSRARLRQRFQSLRDAGWQTGVRLAGTGRGFGAQLDLSALFLERSLELLSDGGALGFLLPAKLARGLSAGALRRRLLAETRILRVEDCSLASPLFEPTTYPLSLLLSRTSPLDRSATAITVHRRDGRPLDFRLPQPRLPLIPNDDEAPWALAPPRVRAVFDRMRLAGPPLGAQPSRRPRRGIFTGANDLFLGEIVRAGSANGCLLVKLGETEIEIEREGLRPVLRGEDVGPWRFSTSRILLWTHSDDGKVLARLPTATDRYLRTHRRALEQRADLKPGQPFWTLFRARPEKWGRRVVWPDIAPAPTAVVVPAHIAFAAGSAPLVSLNTVYQIAAASGEDAHLLAAVLNSTVARAYLKAIAERASGNYFRFLSWTVALLPLPTSPDAAVAAAVIDISREAHADGGLGPGGHVRLDELVARLYRLRPRELATLRRFDAALSGPRNSR